MQQRAGQDALALQDLRGQPEPFQLALHDGVPGGEHQVHPQRDARDAIRAGHRRPAGPGLPVDGHLVAVNGDRRVLDDRGRAAVHLVEVDRAGHHGVRARASRQRLGDPPVQQVDDAAPDGRERSVSSHAADHRDASSRHRCRYVHRRDGHRCRTPATLP